MAKRDPDFRKDVLRLDGYHCVICGFNGEAEEDEQFLQADHVSPRGSGGNPDKDDRANGMTLCDACHKLKTDEIIQIRGNKWDRNDHENGLFITKNGVPMARHDIWFYKKRDKELLEQSIDALSAMASSDGHRAEILAFVWKHYGLVDSSSPQALVSSLGLDPNKAEEEARAYAMLEAVGLNWPDGVNLAKVELILSAMPSTSFLSDEDRSMFTEILLDARSASFNDIKKNLIDRGLIASSGNGSSKDKLFVTCDREEFFKCCKFRLAKECEIEIDDSQILLRVDKVYSPLRKRGGKLLIANGLIEEEVQTYGATT